MTITHSDQCIQIVAISVEIAVSTERQSRHILHQRRTIQLTRVDHQTFVIIDFESMSHVGYAQELTSQLEHRRLAIGLL